MIDENIRNIFEPVLEPGEILQWVAKPKRLHRGFIRLIKIVGAFFFVGFLIQFSLNFVMDGEILIEGEPASFKKIWPPTLITFLSIGVFVYLYRRKFRASRYVLSDRRAFIYSPHGGFYFSTAPMDYSDANESPIIGSYFTPETTVERHGDEKLGHFFITHLESRMHGFRPLKPIFSIMPFLRRVAFDPETLKFYEIENPLLVEKQLNKIISRRKQNE